MSAENAGEGDMRRLIVAVFLLLGGCAHGSSVVTGIARPAITADQVRLYTAPPAQCEVIGMVQAYRDAGLGDHAKLNGAIGEAKEQAARMGANGILIETLGAQAQGFAGTVSNGVFAGGAVMAQTV